MQTTQHEDDGLVTIPDAMALLSISRSKLYLLFGAGVIDSVHIGKSRRIKRSVLAAYINSLPTGAASAG